jgi:plasmid stabilization system protein ParE
MTTPVTFRPEAEFDVEEAFNWYRDQHEDLGDQFLAAVDEAVDQIQRHPRGQPRIYRDVRRALTKRYPYQILYVLRDETVVVVGVFHARRAPESWKDRL